jgi:hypothetical protein
VRVSSGMALIMAWVWLVPAPSTGTGGLRRSRARSARVSTTAPAPSVTRQQSSLCSGLASMGEASTSSTLSGPLSWW